MPIGTMHVMNNHHDILAELDQYAHDTKDSVSAICRKATGNPRLRERLERRLDRVRRDVERLRKFMDSNPPSVRSTDAASSKEIGDTPASFKGEADTRVPTEGA
jgi:ferritin-like metal-binding protein YciE